MSSFQRNQQVEELYHYKEQLRQWYSSRKRKVRKQELSWECGGKKQQQLWYVQRQHTSSILLLLRLDLVSSNTTKSFASEGHQGHFYYFIFQKRSTCISSLNVNEMKAKLKRTLEARIKTLLPSSIGQPYERPCDNCDLMVN